MIEFGVQKKPGGAPGYEARANVSGQAIRRGLRHKPARSSPPRRRGFILPFKPILRANLRRFDALFMRVTLRNILTKSGYEIAGEASNGRESVEMYEKVQPDLVTMDITMPEMDGINAVRQIRQIDPNAKIIMCTAMGQKKHGDGGRGGRRA